MERLLPLYQDRIVGVLEGFDRLLFRGTLRSICFARGLEMFLANQRVLLKDFGGYAERLSRQVKEHAQALAQRLGRPYEYLPSPDTSKEEVARHIRLRDGITAGLICVLACVEPCVSFQVHSQNRQLQVASAPRKCLHLYFYYVDRDFGLMHVRLQTWLPFGIQVCVNGREYLARQLDRAGLGYEQQDNCFTRLDDVPRAQALLDQLQTRRWCRWLDTWARQVLPFLAAPSRPRLRGYYWTLRQGEVATDVMFRDAAALAEVYPALVAHAISQFSCRDVLRFLGRRTNTRFGGEVTTDIKYRPEGVRIKHRVEENTLKMYDKQGSVLRIETTINDPRRFRVRRVVTRNGRRVRRWVPLRKGVVDLPRRAALSRAANRRYLAALAVVGVPAPVHRVLDPVSRARVQDGRRYRGLRPLTAAEADLFRLALDGRFALQGLRNGDVRALWAQGSDAQTRRRLSGRATRCLRLLRAHGLLGKVSGTRYYRVTARGQQVMTTALRLRELDLTQLVN
jgi:hypothetical protein